MPFQSIPIDHLSVNPANDRHGELRDEAAAIDELFRMHEPRMRALTHDIAAAGRIFDPPLVMLHDDAYVVFDGNRRVTCMKLLIDPEMAPSDEIRNFFREERANFKAHLPTEIQCQLELDRDAIDEILFRRHTGTQGGVGQIGWDDRAKRNFVERTGRGDRVNVGAAIENELRQVNFLPTTKIPWSTLTRLLSSEHFRGRVGISTAGRQFRYTHQREAVLPALQRIANDLAEGHLTLGHLWNNEGKRRYLDELEADGILPTERSRLEHAEQVVAPKAHQRQPGRPPRRHPASRTLIPAGTAAPQWTAQQQKESQIWYELSRLPIRTYPHACAALLRMLLELSIEGYVREHGLQERAELSRRVGAVARSLFERDLLDARYLQEIERIRRDDELISIASMQRLLHSPDFAPMEQEFRAYWNRLGRLITSALTL